MPFSKFFFDFPLIDVNAIACSAFRLIYHNSAHGSLCSSGTNAAREPKMVNLNKVEAFKINLQHLSSHPLSDDYEYNLVFLNKELSDHIWKGEKRAISSDLRKLTRRVQLSDFPSLAAKRYRTSFWTKFRRPVHIAKCDSSHFGDFYTPSAYQKKLHGKFQSFLMRTEVGYPLVRNILEAHGLALSERREILDPISGDLEVLSYEVDHRYSTPTHRSTPTALLAY